MYRIRDDGCQAFCSSAPRQSRIAAPAGAHAGKPSLPLQRLAIVVGGDKHCHLHLVSSTISRHHAIIIAAADGVYIHDLASRTKIHVNDEQVLETVLNNGDVIRIGRFIFNFAAPARSNPAACEPASVSVNGNSARPLESRVLLIGRHQGADVHIQDDAVSVRHAVIFEAAGKRFIRDLYSRTGTFLNGKKIHQEEINFGDQVRIGSANLSLSSLDAAAAPGTAEDLDIESFLAEEPATLEIPAELEPEEPKPIAPPVPPPRAPVRQSRRPPIKLLRPLVRRPLRSRSSRSRSRWI